MFLSDPGMVPCEGHPDLWWLDRSLEWEDDLFGYIVIPPGFVSDDASTPKFLDWIPWLDRQGLSRLPGLLHDGAYSLGREKGKEWCDRLLEAACFAEGMSKRQAHIYYLGVHWFGAPSWASDAREGKAGAIESGDFFSQEHYDAWVKHGATIFQPAH